MGLRERWNKLDTGMQILVGLSVGAVVILIAIPVVLILAAVVASFVLGMGEPETGAPETPQASFDFDLDAGESMALRITHAGGDTLRSERLSIEVGDRTEGWDGPASVSAGDSTTVTVQPADTVRLVWTGEGESATLGSYETPGAT